MIVLQDEVNEKVVSLCIRGGKISAQILKKHRCRSCSGRWNSPKSGKKFLERGRKKKPYIMGNRAWKTESTQSGAF